MLLFSPETYVDENAINSFFLKSNLTFFKPNLICVLESYELQLLKNSLEENFFLLFKGAGLRLATDT